MAAALAALAAFSNALTTILQRLGVRDAPEEDTLHLRLIAYAIHKKVWLAGFGLMVASFLLQATALDFGDMTSVQPVLTLELPFLVVILAVWFRLHPRALDWAATVVAAGGLATFLLLAHPETGTRVPGLRNWGEVVFACLAGIVVTVALARVGPPSWRAAMFGVAGAVAFALAAAFIKATTDLITEGWSHLMFHWEPYGVIGAGLLGVFLAQNAFHAGPITASQSTLVTVDPLTSVAIGIGLFGDRLDTSGPRGPLEALALLALIVGVIVLARSPLVASAKHVDAPRSGAEPDPAGAPASGTDVPGALSKPAEPPLPPAAPGGVSPGPALPADPLGPPSVPGGEQQRGDGSLGSGAWGTC